MFKNRSYILFFTALAILVLIASCKKKKEAAAIPFIEFTEHTWVADDSLTFKFHFIDGDGDIGFRAGEVDPPFNFDDLPGDPLYIFSYYDNNLNDFVTDTTNLNYYNVIAEYSYLENGVWITPLFKPGSVYRLDDITPDGQDKYLEGDLTFGISVLETTFPWQRDSMKFKITLKDRALNSSNVVETPLILLP